MKLIFLAFNIIGNAPDIKIFIKNKRFDHPRKKKSFRIA